MEIKVGQATPVRVPTLVGSEVVTATTAAWALYSPQGALEAEGAATVGPGAVVASLPPLERLGEGWRLDVTFTLADGRTGTATAFLDTVRLLLVPTLTDDDIRRAYPRLDDKQWVGEADWSWARDLAWEELMQAVRAKGYRPALIAPSSESLKLPHLHLTLSAIFRSLFTDTTDRWYARWQEHASKADALVEGLARQLRFDADQDGLVDTTPAASMSSGCYELRR